MLVEKQLKRAKRSRLALSSTRKAAQRSRQAIVFLLAYIQLLGRKLTLCSKIGLLCFPKSVGFYSRLFGLWQLILVANISKRISNKVMHTGFWIVWITMLGAG